jgi:hypothetical protein
VGPIDPVKVSNPAAAAPRRPSADRQLHYRQAYSSSLNDDSVFHRSLNGDATDEGRSFGRCGNRY